MLPELDLTPPQREETFPYALPLSSEEQFNEAEAALREETVRRKMVSNCLFCHRNIVHIANLKVQKALKESPPKCFDLGPHPELIGLNSHMHTH